MLARKIYFFAALNNQIIKISLFSEMVNTMGMESLFGQTEMNMLENGKMDYEMEREHSFGEMAKNMAKTMACTKCVGHFYFMEVHYVNRQFKHSA